MPRLPGRAFKAPARHPAQRMRGSYTLSDLGLETARTVAVVDGQGVLRKLLWSNSSSAQRVSPVPTAAAAIILRRTIMQLTTPAHSSRHQRHRPLVAPWPRPGVKATIGASCGFAGSNGALTSTSRILRERRRNILRLRRGRRHNLVRYHLGCFTQLSNLAANQADLGH